MTAIDKISDAPELLTDFTHYLYDDCSKSVNTAMSYCGDLKLLLRYVKFTRLLTHPSIPVSEINITDVDADFIKSITAKEYKKFLKYSYRSKKPVSDTSRYRRACAVNRFLDYLQLREIIDDADNRKLELPERKKKKLRYLNDSECKTLLKTCENGGRYAVRDTCIVQLFISCGLRTRELVGLNISDIYPDHVHVLNSRGEERDVRFGKDCREAIDKYLEIRDDGLIKEPYADALFISQSNKRISPRAVDKMLRQKLRLAGFKEGLYSPNKLRHTAAAKMINEGYNTEDLQKMLGHQSKYSPEVYSVIKPKLKNPWTGELE